MYFAVKLFTARDGAKVVENRDFLPNSPAFDAALGGSRRNIAMRFGMEKTIEWCDPMVKKWKIGLCLFVSTEYINVTDRQTDERTEGQRATA